MYFDPHNHLNGIVPYRVLALLADATDDLADGRSGTAIANELLVRFAGEIHEELGLPGTEGPLPLEVFEGYLAHRELISTSPSGDPIAVKVKAPDANPASSQVWASPLAYETGVREGRTYPRTAVTSSETLARIEFLLIARFFDVVSRMVTRACEKMAGRDTADAERWQKKARRLTGPASSQVLPALVDAMQDVYVRHQIGEWRTWLKNPAERFRAAPYQSAAKEMKHLLQHAFTSTPLTDYDTAYAVRGFLTDPTLFGRNGPPLTTQAVFAAGVRELARQGIEYAEVSAGWDEIDKIGAWNPARGVKVGWLVAIPHMLFTGDSETDFDHAVDELATALAGGKGVVGFSMLSPEASYAAASRTGRFTARLQKLLDALEDADRETVAHLHVGEGTARWQLGPEHGAGRVQSEERRKEIRELLLRKRSGVRPRLDEEASREQARIAEENVGAVLDALAGCRRPDLVRIRLGHVTRAISPHAQRMAEATPPIWADVNLTSNIATSVWNDERRAVDVKRLEAEHFRGHAVHELVKAKVPFVLGTDGSGVEHSAMMVERSLLETIAGRPALDSATASGKAHMEWIASSLHRASTAQGDRPLAAAATPSTAAHGKES
jgi:hypothetical protein